MKDEGTRLVVEDDFPVEAFDGSWLTDDVTGLADGGSSSAVDEELMFGSAVLSELMARIELMSGSRTPFDRFCASLRKLMHAVRR